MSDLIFLHGNHDSHCTARVDKFFEGYYTLQFMARGSVELYYDEVHHKLQERWFWTAFPGPRIRFHAAPEHGFWEHRYVAFQGLRVRSWHESGLWPHSPQPAPDGEEWEARFDELLAQTRRATSWSATRATHLLEGILLDLAEARSEVKGAVVREPWLETVMRVLENEEAFAPDYKYLAAECGMGLSTLRRRFKEATGCAIHNYVLQNRIAMARRLLGESDLPLKAIALRLGYRDVYFFAAQFRQSTGVTPAAYRRSRQV